MEIGEMQHSTELIYQFLNKYFEPMELRQYEVQKSIMSHKEYHTDIIGDCQHIRGLLAWWDFRRIIFVEYVVVDQNSRNQGIASLLLDSLMKHNRQIVLEVKDTSENKNLEAFYIKKGFCKNNFRYHAMKLRKAERKQKYHLYSYPFKLSIRQYLYFQRCIHNPTYQR